MRLILLISLALIASAEIRKIDPENQGKESKWDEIKEEAKDDEIKEEAKDDEKPEDKKDDEKPEDKKDDEKPGEKTEGMVDDPWVREPNFGVQCPKGTGPDGTGKCNIAPQACPGGFAFDRHGRCRRV